MKTIRFLSIARELTEQAQARRSAASATLARLDATYALADEAAATLARLSARFDAPGPQRATAAFDLSRWLRECEEEV
jgi:Tfp pilus assembly protein PilV